MKAYEETFKDQINDLLLDMDPNNPIAKEVINSMILDITTLFINDV